MQKPPAAFAAFIGIDWANKKHDICLALPGSDKRERSVLEHRSTAIRAWAEALRARFGGAPVAVCLELSQGPIVSALLEHDFFVLFPVQPLTLARYRNAFTTSRAKDDPTDAELALELLLRHPDKLSRLEPDSVPMRTLRRLVEARRTLVQDRVRLTNRASSAKVADPGAAALPDDQRYSSFEGPCVRDSQCGPGKCLAGECYYGCQSDAQCGTGDRCAVETGTRICEPDPNPPVTCTRSAQCGAAAVCLNASCHQTCETTEQCQNLLDRCASGVCQPDRRPLGQCVLNSECSAGFVCLDGACVSACYATPDAGVCLATSASSSAGLPEPPVLPPAATTPGTLDAGALPPDLGGVDAGSPPDAAVAPGDAASEVPIIR